MEALERVVTGKQAAVAGLGNLVGPLAHPLLPLAAQSPPRSSEYGCSNLEVQGSLMERESKSSESRGSHRVKMINAQASCLLQEQCADNIGNALRTVSEKQQALKDIFLHQKK